MNGATGSPKLGARMFVALQYLLPQHLLSRAVLSLTRLRLRPVKDSLIGAFVRHFQPDMSEARDRDPLSYPSFNAFFTRELVAGARRPDPDVCALASPADGTVSQIGRLSGSTIVQAKGHDYSVQALLGGASKWSDLFTGGSFATVYLAPYNYHRVHMPVSGLLREAWFVPGTLFSVNATTAAAVPGLFARNERVILILQSEAVTFAVVLVGALFVGSMSTVWHGDIAPRKRRGPVLLPAPRTDARRLEKGAELGRFNMGSTVILLLPDGAVQWRPELAAGSTVRVGETLGRLEIGAGSSGAAQRR